MAGSVRRPQKFEDMLKKLRDDPEQKIFKTFKDAIVFAACLGFEKERRVSFEKATQDPIRLHVFNGPYDIDVINMIAVAEKEDPNVLSEKNEEDKIKIFEEYACGGLEIIDEMVYKEGDWQLNLLNLILGQQNSGENVLDDIADLV